MTSVNDVADSTQSDSISSNHLARLVIELLREIVELKRAGQTYREGTRVAVSMLADLNRQLASKERQIRQLRAELRAAVSGRTIADERQALEFGDGVAA